MILNNCWATKILSEIFTTGDEVGLIMAVFGQIDHFFPDSETLSVYLERVDLFFSANNVPDERKVPLLLTVIGASAYGVLHNLMTPENPKTKSYAELVTALKQHYEPKPLVIAERFHFYQDSVQYLGRHI